MRRLSVLAAVLFLCFTSSASAQTAVEVTAGSTRTYLDISGSLTLGGGLRIPITERVSFSPEVLRLTHEEYDGWHVNGNVAYEFDRGRARPYLVAGVGMSQDTQKVINYTHREISVSGGAGLRLFLADKVYIAPEARLGFHQWPRLTVTLGVLLR